MNNLAIIFKRIKDKNLNIIITMLIGFSIGALNGFIHYLLILKKQKIFFHGLVLNDEEGFNKFFFLLLVFIIPILTLFFRLVIGWCLGRILGFKGLKKLTEIIIFSYFSCFLSLLPAFGGLLEIVLNGFLVFLGFEVYYQKRNWRTIIISIATSLIVFTQFGYIK